MFASRSFSLLILLTLVIPFAASASFSDVLDDAPFAPHIAALADRGIVRGNPDGTFRPDATINRAELLTLLYRATERTPAESMAGCFKDIGRGSWYESIVCDASAQGFVSGYPDRTFRPQQSVNRIEALKMLHTVFGFDHPESMPPALGASFEDIDLSAWYAPYLASAYMRQVIPVSGQEGPMFQPGALLMRGEAAAYIAQALQLVLPDQPSSASSSQSSAQSSSSLSQTVENAVGADVIDESFPFQDTGTFHGRTTHVIRFTITQASIGEVKTTVDSGMGKTGLTCRLFRMGGKDGFSNEYYFGYVVGNVCVIRIALQPADYQLEVRPMQENASYIIDGITVIGDGNDGFSEARSIGIGKNVSGIIEEDDIADWYTFTLNRPQTLRVELAEESGNSCIVYAMDDVDLFGFSTPQCNATFEYPRGTYVIGVQRRDARSGALTYNIGLR